MRAFTAVLYALDGFVEVILPDANSLSFVSLTHQNRPLSGQPAPVGFASPTPSPRNCLNADTTIFWFAPLGRKQFTNRVEAAGVTKSSRRSQGYFFENVGLR